MVSGGRATEQNREGPAPSQSVRPLSILACLNVCLSICLSVGLLILLSVRLQAVSATASALAVGVCPAAAPPSAPSTWHPAGRGGTPTSWWPRTGAAWRCTPASARCHYTCPRYCHSARSPRSLRPVLAMTGAAVPPAPPGGPRRCCLGLGPRAAGQLRRCGDGPEGRGPDGTRG